MQSLHTTVLPLNTTTELFPLEVHIRTDEMHRLAEYGIAGENWTSPGAAAAIGSGRFGASSRISYSRSDVLTSGNGAVSPTAVEGAHTNGSSNRSSSNSSSNGSSSNGSGSNSNGNGRSSPSSEGSSAVCS